MQVGKLNGKDYGSGPWGHVKGVSISRISRVTFDGVD